jgi:hypothetical protein
MKLNICLLSFLFLISATVHAQKSVPGEYNGKVVFISAPQPGSVTVSCTGDERKQFRSKDNAEASAFYTLLFRGIPGSQYELPMIADENEKRNDPTVVNLLKGGYSSFITEASLMNQHNTSRRAEGKKGVSATYQITINCDALRKYLEQNGVIRKFGI